jgi:hypothetical protein
MDASITTGIGIAAQTKTSDPIIDGTVPLKIDEVDRRGDEAWDSLKANPDWKKWIAIAEAMMSARTICMRDTHSNRPAGRGYNAAFSTRLAKRKFGNMDGSDRARLLKCMENKLAIEAWRETSLTPNACGSTIRLQSCVSGRHAQRHRTRRRRRRHPLSND